jgi:uncharacterized protein (TIGR03083 family)
VAWPQLLGPPIDARSALAPERRALLKLLEDLSRADWERSTVCPGWTVWDIAAHLLGDDLARLARSRDDHDGLAPRPAESLPDFLNRINDEWVTAARRLSPALLIDLLQWTGEQVERFWLDQDLQRLGEPVSWAGPHPAPVWLDAARDFTEYWIHRQQIHDALCLPDDPSPHVRHLVFDTLIRALPYALRDRVASTDAAVTVTVTGTGGGSWTVRSFGGEWTLVTGSGQASLAHVVLPGDTAWRLWTRGIEPETARRRAALNGDPDLGEVVLRMVSIIR